MAEGPQRSSGAIRGDQRQSAHLDESHVAEGHQRGDQRQSAHLDESHVARGRGCVKRCNGCGGRPDADTSKRISVEVASATSRSRRRDAKLYCSLRCKFAPLDEPCGSSGAVLGGGLVAMGDVPIAGAVAGAVAGGLERKASAVTSAILILVAGQWMRT